MQEYGSYILQILLVTTKQNLSSLHCNHAQERNQPIWAIYNDLSRGHPKWWFSKGILPKMALN